MSRLNPVAKIIESNNDPIFKLKQYRNGCKMWTKNDRYFYFTCVHYSTTGIAIKDGGNYTRNGKIYTYKNKDPVHTPFQLHDVNFNPIQTVRITSGFIGTPIAYSN